MNTITQFIKELETRFDKDTDKDNISRIERTMWRLVMETKNDIDVEVTDMSISITRDKSEPALLTMRINGTPVKYTIDKTTLKVMREYPVF